MRRHPHLLRIVLVNLAVLGVGIAVLELVFGAWINPDGLNRLNLIKRPFEYDVSGLYETATPTIRYSRDQYGLRGDYGNDPSRIELLTVGGSTTDQRYIADGSTWQDVLGDALASNRTPMVIANAGVDGQTTFGHIKNFDWWFPFVPRLKPRYILFYAGLNDLYVDEETIYDKLVAPDRNALVTSIRENSALWHLIRTVRGAYLASRVLRIGHQRMDFTQVQWTREPLQADYGFLSKRLDAYAGRLRILADRTRSLGAEPVFVTQPSRLFRLSGGDVEGRAEGTDYGGRPINGVDFYWMMARFNGAMEAVAHEKQARLVDLFRMSAWENDDFYDFAHMTPKGARKVGLALFQELRGMSSYSQPLRRNLRSQ